MLSMQGLKVDIILSTSFVVLLNDRHWVVFHLVAELSLTSGGNVVIEFVVITLLIVELNTKEIVF